jgi:hypothetical protein
MRQLGKPYVEYALCLLLKRRRMALPMIDPAVLWPEYETVPVTITTLPKGDWATPTNDTVVLMKLAAVLAPLRILELGSYRGYSAVAMLEHAPSNAQLTAVDIDPQHGEAYRCSPLESRVDRRVAPVGFDAFDAEEHGSYDLVFIDADHAPAAARRDTEVALKMVAPGGTVLWHDYANWGWFSGACGVPEVLNDLATRLPIAHVVGSNIAIHQPRWCRHQDELDVATRRTAEELGRDHWSSAAPRRYA